MFRYPEIWAKKNARFSHEKFDLPMRLASTKRAGILMMILAAFSLVSMLTLNLLVQLR
jgi:hypothetical protein